MEIKQNLDRIKQTLPAGVTLVAVSKTKPVELIMEAYEAGHRDFGENKIQEMVEKQAKLPEDIRWHMIGHVQRNKVKYMAPFVHMIHGVDSLKLLREINKQAVKNQRTINCLLQVKIASEESKFGMDLKDTDNLLSSPEISELKHIRIRGFMGMATFTDDMNQVRGEFKKLQECTKLFHRYESDNCRFDQISMGMSGDYEVALEEGSTMVRIGSSIFGSRQ